jgi:hypothetical protein
VDHSQPGSTAAQGAGTDNKIKFPSATENAEGKQHDEMIGAPGDMKSSPNSATNDNAASYSSRLDLSLDCTALSEFAVSSGN